MKIILIIFSFLVMNSCSINSNQYNFVKNILTESEDISLPKKNWSLIVEDKVIDLYAINFQDQIIFADERINIFYKDNHIYKVTGLYPDAASLEVIKNINSLEYIVNNQSLLIDICDSMVIAKKNKQKIQSIKCHHESSRATYINQIKLNSDGLVIGLRFKIRPGYPPIELKIKQNVHYN